jgi:PAS domain-containing protein
MYQQSLRRWEGGRAVALAELPRSSSTPLRSVTGLQSAVQGIHATRGRARQLWRIFQTSRIPMTVADSRRRHLAANAPARLFFRLTLADVLERRIDDLTPPDKMHLLYDRWARLMGSGKVAGPYDLCLPDGSEPSIVYSAVANALPAST